VVRIVYEGKEWPWFALEGEEGDEASPEVVAAWAALIQASALGEIADALKHKPVEKPE
jgi:hypothetical protein